MRSTAWTFRRSYFALAVGLFLAEVAIARYAHDGFVRPYGGDFLAAIWLYCLGRSFLPAAPGRVAVGALLSSYAIEGLQYFQLLARLGWQDWQVARIVLGSSFSWGDMLAYTLGIGVVLVVERGRG